MNCKRIRELVKTDYIDGEASAEVQKETRAHLNICNQCRQFERALQEMAIEPFKKAREIRPPELVWHRIKEAIEKKPSEGLFAGLRNSLDIIFGLRKPVIAGVIIAVIVVIMTVFIKLPLNNQQAMSSYLEEQIEFISCLDADEVGYFNGGQLDLGTAIEEYFL